MNAFVIRAVVAGIAGIVVIGALAPTSDLGILAGLLGGTALSVAVAFSRVRRGALALPPLHSVIGVAVFALCVVAAACPTVFYMPRWIVGVLSETTTTTTTTRTRTRTRTNGGDRVLSGGQEVIASVVDYYAEEHGRYRAAFAELLGVDDLRCNVDLIFGGDDEYAKLATAAQHDATDIADAKYGFAIAPLLGRRAAVVPWHVGRASVVRHVASLWVPCALPRAPPWVVEGVATLAEQHHLVEAPDNGGARIDLRWRSDRYEPERSLRSDVRDLDAELRSADDAGFLRAFFLYLEARGQLRPLLARIRSGVEARQALADITQMDAIALEADWRVWLERDAADIPWLPRIFTSP